MTNSKNQINKQEVLAYTENGVKNANVLVKDREAWITQKSMSEIFGISTTGIGRHIKNIFDDGELDDNSTNMQKMHIANSDKPVSHYSVDVAISVGYRVNSHKATQFRRWANGILKQYIKDGYVLNEEALKNNPEKLNELASKIRELRASEKNVYASVKECFKLAASDYEPSSVEVRRFYTLLQDKFHHAVTKMTASKLIMDRANHVDPNMGLMTMAGEFPTLKEAKVGKNYLKENELYLMHLLSDQFLMYAESISLRGKELTMKQLHEKLDVMLVANDYDVFGGYDDYSKAEAMRIAEDEFNNYMEIKKLELLGVQVDYETFYEGGYSDYKEETAKLTTRKMNQMLKAQQLPESEKQKALPPYNPWG